MRKRVLLVTVAALCTVPALAQREDGPDELVRVFCDVNDAANNCPGDDCLCSEDRFEVVFADQLENSVLDLAAFEQDMEVQSHIAFDAVSPEIRGYSFGVSHDSNVLELVVTEDGLNMDNTPVSEFLAMQVQLFASIDPSGTDGYVVGVLFGLADPVVLPPQRTLVANAKYLVKADPGAEGTVITITDQLGRPPTAVEVAVDVFQCAEVGSGDPGTDEINCTDGLDDDGDGLIDCDDPDCTVRNSAARSPTTVVDGLIRVGGMPPAPPPPPPPPPPPGKCPEYAFYFGGEAIEGDVMADGPGFPVAMRNSAPASGFQLGVKVSPGEAGLSVWEFSGELGSRPEIPITLLIPDENLNANVPSTPNRVMTTTFELEVGNFDVALGAGIPFAGNGDSFFWSAITAETGVGGPGFTAGYIADLMNVGNVIAPVDPAGCDVTEILTVSLGAPPVDFLRGDADGNERINITDAIIIIQTALGFVDKTIDCDDIIDTNDNGTIDVTDGIPPLTYLFQDEDPLPTPFPGCGMDATEDSLTCAESNCAAP